MNHSVDGSNSQMQRDLIKQLEARNREIILEIQKLRAEQERQARCSPSHAGSGVNRNPTLVAELKGLRQRRDELEARMSALQESRRELVVQLEGLMKLLKNHSSPRLTPRSTPTSSPRSRAAQSPPPSIPPPRGSAPTTPGDSLAGVGGDVREAFTQQSSGSGISSVRNLRNDLLVAADSVTNAMSSLVKELNSEVESESEDEDDRARGNGDSMDDLLQWQEEMRKSLQQETQFMQELRARRDNPGGGKAGYSNGRTQREQYPMTDDCESYVHTDDEGAYTAEESEPYLKSEEEVYARAQAEFADLLQPQHSKDLLHPRYMTDEESCLETDQESYIRTDDEDGGNTEWEENRRRWVNR
ncbi:hypothetical protein NP493_109g00013 [Ridgeia piscesae]|uniref:Dystrobrevin beta-like n=1 Tax=Ridgeia piscesae TaxID=27915 RepID=A0AAD9P6Z2_RIDPI|nr:hypothetical protein NP493_109g00013 [Ridgeia piscesae]